MYFTSYVSYFELNKEYIIQKYCVNKAKPKLQCNGKCHLSKKLTAVTITDSSENEFKAMLSSFENIFTPLYYTTTFSNFEPAFIDLSQTEYGKVLSKDYSLFLSVNSPPPKV